MVLLSLLAHSSIAGTSAQDVSLGFSPFTEFGRSSPLTESDETELILTRSSVRRSHVSPEPAIVKRSTLLLQRDEAMQKEWAEAKRQSRMICTEDADCAWHARCKSSTEQCEALRLGQMLGADILMCLLAFVIAGFSLAAGVGGGGLYVPLLMFILSLETRFATALSQAMLFGGASAALVYNFQMSHPSRPKRPLINYELALLMAPALMGGAQVGSVIHALAPPVVTLALLLLVLGDAARKGIRSAINISAKEEKQDDTDTSQPSEATPADDKSGEVWARSDSARNRLLLVWVLCIVLVATKGLLFEMCSPMWWTLSVGSAALLCGLSWMFATAVSEQDPVDADDIDFREKAFPLAKMSMLAGTIAALCGIGGGMVMGPILVELKIPPPVSTATTATTLVVLSTSTLLIYICRGMAPPDYAICLSIFTFCGAGVGKMLVGWWVRKTGKQSIIVWTLAGVTVCSMLLMGLEGVLTFSRDSSAFFAFRDLCQGHLHHSIPRTD